MVERFVKLLKYVILLSVTRAQHDKIRTHIYYELTGDGQVLILYVALTQPTIFSIFE